MRVRIHPKVYERYVLTCYPSSDGFRVSFNKGFAEKIKKIAGQWIDIDTEYLFGDQLNTVPIEDISELGLRLNHWAFSEIEDDVRNHDTYKCIDFIIEKMGEENAGAVYHRREELTDDVLQKYYEEYAETHQIKTEDLNINVIKDTLMGKRHHCRPVAPLVETSNEHRYFYYSRLRDDGSPYTFTWAKRNGIIDL